MMGSTHAEVGCSIVELKIVFQPNHRRVMLMKQVDGIKKPSTGSWKPSLLRKLAA